MVPNPDGWPISPFRGCKPGDRPWKHIDDVFCFSPKRLCIHTCMHARTHARKEVAGKRRSTAAGHRPDSCQGRLIGARQNAAKSPEAAWKGESEGDGMLIRCSNASHQESDRLCATWCFSFWGWLLFFLLLHPCRSLVPVFAMAPMGLTAWAFGVSDWKMGLEFGGHWKRGNRGKKEKR